MSTPGPLSGIRVVDLGHFIAAPYAAAVLADLGAEVIKVEDPDRVDDARHTGPHFLDGESLYYLAFNWGKRSLALRFATSAGRGVMLDLLRTCDVLIDNYKPRVMERLGLDHGAVSAVNPRIITCSLTGYGETGAYATRSGYDYTIQALSGAMSLTGEPGAPPEKAGLSYVDHSGGLAAALAVCAALFERERTGTGRHIDLALFDTQISMLTYLAAWVLNSDARLVRTANSAHQSLVPAQNFATADGWISVFAGNDRNWEQLAGCLGDPRLREAVFATNAGRLSNRERLLTLLEEDFRQLATAEALERLVAAGVPCAPVNTVSEALASPPVADRNLVVESTHSRYGVFRHAAGPVPALGGSGTMPSPVLGEHSLEIMRSIGYADARIRELVEQGTVVGPSTAPTG